MVVNATEKRSPVLETYDRPAADVTPECSELSNGGSFCKLIVPAALKSPNQSGRSFAAGAVGKFWPATEKNKSNESAAADQIVLEPQENTGITSDESHLRFRTPSPLDVPPFMAVGALY